jgi:hypothetical protein
MRWLKKSEIEDLLATYDDDATGSLVTAIGLTLGITLDSWEQAVSALPYDALIKNDLMHGSTAALDRLLKRFVEERTL